MFAVPGWAVSAEPLVSLRPTVIASKASATEPALPTSRLKSKKRRRNENGSPSKSYLTSEDLHRLWKKEFGEGSGVEQKPAKSRKRKKQKIQPGSTLTHADHTVLEVHNESGSDIHAEDGLDFKDDLKKPVEQKSGLKCKNGKRKISISDERVDKLLEKRGTGDSAYLSQQPGQGKATLNSQSTSQNRKVRKSLQKLEELPSPTSMMMTPLQARMRVKLTSARFRHLNETLYTSPSSASLDLFTASPDLFAEYHAGFAQQVRSSWPQNPVDGYIGDIDSRAKVDFRMQSQPSTVKVLPLPRRKTGSCTIADLGCGDASLARAFRSTSKALGLRFHNFDLHAPNSTVTKADIADLPLRDGEADVAVFCLSLMGTNWISFIEEAWRVLRGDGKGELWVAEVKSRFGRITKDRVVENSVGKKRKLQKPRAQQERRAGLAEDDADDLLEDDDHATIDETDITAFRDVVQRRGFVLQPDSVNKHNKMFVSMIFTKTGIPVAGKHQGSKWNGHEYEKSAGWMTGRKKFIDQSIDDEGYLSPKEESRVLKPCVYKKR
ncbi:hypothetical protein EPUS_02287 [Endocarpon pusillum Z07020]|uniref:Ribosomal RNA-processing protein 8 n=1 Tax=Endocarpon pusillum (strain Z07020 / HMAS-L-300199) TaxID=1263415 RepID=U1GW92_ENDPU|nr:uncharacterized protein EPUS_02287 [Endocarpon pusillum Z07020]ERF76748.1 hypothetical protein EPUS_02287 [Endocarpon pusillum Z07020]